MAHLRFRETQTDEDSAHIPAERQTDRQTRRQRERVNALLPSARRGRQGDEIEQAVDRAG